MKLEHFSIEGESFAGYILTKAHDSLIYIEGDFTVTQHPDTKHQVPCVRGITAKYESPSGEMVNCDPKTIGELIRIIDDGIANEPERLVRDIMDMDEER